MNLHILPRLKVSWRVHNKGNRLIPAVSELPSDFDLKMRYERQRLAEAEGVNFLFFTRGEEIKRNENDVSLIPLPVTQPASQRFERRERREKR